MRIATTAITGHRSSKPKRETVLSNSHFSIIPIVTIRHVTHEGRFPAVAPPVEVADEPAQVVTDCVQLVAERAGTRRVPSGDDAEIVVERHGNNAESVPPHGLRDPPYE